MKKKLILLFILSIFIFPKQIADALLTDEAPIKHKSGNVTTLSNINSTSEIETYKNKVHSIIDAKNKFPPNYAGDLSTEIEFGIAENGRLNYAIVKKSSGQSWYDSRVGHLVHNIYDPLPDNFQGTCPRMYETSYGKRKCLVMTHTFNHKKVLPENYVKPKKEIEKNEDNHIEDMKKSAEKLF